MYINASTTCTEDSWTPAVRRKFSSARQWPRCAAPACNDGARNCGETAVDCGGPCATKCTAGQGCSTSVDCAVSLACDAGTCAADPVDCVVSEWGAWGACDVTCEDACEQGTCVPLPLSPVTEATFTPGTGIGLPSVFDLYSGDGLQTPFADGVSVVQLFVRAGLAVFGVRGDGLDGPALAFALMRRCGLAVDVQHHEWAYDFLARGTSGAGYLWYEDEVASPTDWADQGRTAAAALANRFSPLPGTKYRQRSLAQTSQIGAHPESFPDTHGSPILGMGFAAAATAFSQPDFRALMEANRWWFALAQCTDGSYYYQPNRDNAGYGADSRISASAVTAFIFSIPQKRLALTGKK